MLLVQINNINNINSGFVNYKYMCHELSLFCLSISWLNFIVTKVLPRMIFRLFQGKRQDLWSLTWSWLTTSCKRCIPPPELLHLAQVINGSYMNYSSGGCPQHAILFSHSFTYTQLIHYCNIENARGKIKGLHNLHDLLLPTPFL